MSIFLIFATNNDEGEKGREGEGEKDMQQLLSNLVFPLTLERKKWDTSLTTILFFIKYPSKTELI